MPKRKPNKRYTPEFKIMVVETLKNYIEWYNNKRIRLKLDDLSPVQFRLLSA